MTASTTSIAQRRAQRRVILATGIGTTIEWYDFFLYAMAAGLVFGPLFFSVADPAIALLLSFASIGISFLFRPLGAVLAGHFGDRIGRKWMLILTVVLMGAATTLMGVLPTYEQIGIAAPILLVALRILQGLSAGGEWGGAALMAVESAPKGWRSRFGSAPQQGSPIGLILATGSLALMSAISPTPEAFLAWGWRVPFLFSAALIVVAYFIRRGVEESPVFQQMSSSGDVRRVPIVQLFRKHALLVLIAALIYAGNSGASYIVAGGFLQSYATSDNVAQPFTTSEVLTVVALSGVVWIAALHLAAVLGDRIGRRNTYIIGWILTAAATFPLIAAMHSGSIVVLFIAIAAYMAGLMFTYGPMSAFFAEMFPADVRYSGIAIAYALGSILGGAFAPTIAQSLTQTTGSVYSVGIYVIALVAISFTATMLIRDRPDIDLGPDSVEAGTTSAVRGLTPHELTPTVTAATR